MDNHHHNALADTTIKLGGSKIEFIIQLGDIIQIVAPDSSLDDKIFVVEYTDSQIVKLLDAETLEETTLAIKNATFVNDAITGWTVLSREPEKGYARLYGYEKGIWLNVHFGGEIPMILTGQITDLEEDMIEITPLMEPRDPIYIDFAYHGIPPELHIHKIEIREEPLTVKQKKTTDQPIVSQLTEETEPLKTETNGNFVITLPENIPDQPEEVGEDIIEDEEEFKMYVEIPENEKQYNIDIQTAELLETLIQLVPPAKRGPRELQEIHSVVERYKQLRNSVYDFDKNGYIQRRKPQTTNPLADKIASLKNRIDWIMPMIQLKKKVYRATTKEELDEPPEDIVFPPILTGESVESQIQLFDNTVFSGGSTIYENYKLGIAEAHRPFTNVQATDTIPVMSDMDMIIYNDNNKKSSVIGIDKENDFFVKQEAFVVQRATTEPPQILAFKQKDVREPKWKELESDKITFKSILVFPQVMIERSRIYLPMTDMLERTQLSHLSLPHSAFLRYGKVNKTGEKWINQPSTTVSIYSKTTETTASPSFSANDLKTILPSIHKIIDQFHEKLNQISVYEIVRHLEPYAIYRDNIDYSAYQKIKDVMEQATKSYLKGLVSKSNVLKKWSFPKGSSLTDSKSILRLVQSVDSTINAKFKELFGKTYHNPGGKALSSSELLLKITTTDYGRLLYSMISYILYYLIAPSKLIMEGLDAELDDIPEKETRLSVSDKCRNHSIAKRYTTERELLADNGKAVFYDKEFDDTPYDIYNTYKADKKKYTDAEFREFLKVNMRDRHHCPAEQVDEMIDRFLAGKRPIKDGDYAVLAKSPALYSQYKDKELSDKEKEEIKMEAKHKTEYTYYVRATGRWVLDPELEDENGDLLDRWTKGVAECKKDTAVKKCEPMIKKAVDQVYLKSIGEKAEEMNESIELFKTAVMAKNILQEKTINQKYQMGEKVTLLKQKQSPFAPLRQDILSEPDFPRKQQYILAFYTKYCREAYTKEDIHWGYCRETNVKLFPVSLYRLATAFANGKYAEMLDKLAFEIGELSTDGDSVIDKHTGYVLKHIDSSAEEGYDEQGFKITTNAIIEQDAVDVVLKEMETRTFENETANKIYAVFGTLKQKTGIKDEQKMVENFVLEHSIRFLCQPGRLPKECIIKDIMFLTLKQFNTMEENKKKKNEKYQNLAYDVYMNRNIISITMAMFLVAIQTSVPTIQPRKNYPNCHYSYQGFPMTDGNNRQGIDFISCVLFSAVKERAMNKNPELWKSVNTKSYTVEMLQKTVYDILNFVLFDEKYGDKYLVKLYEDKKTYLALVQEDKIPQHLDVRRRWTHFLPPIVPFSVKDKATIMEKGTFNELKLAILHGKSSQHSLLNSYASKIRVITFSTIEKIQDIVKKTKIGLPASFIQNACCNDTNVSAPIPYFIGQDETIKHNIVSANQIEKVYREYRPHLAMLHFSKKTKGDQVKPSFSNNGIYKEEVIYEAYIHYCNYDNDMPTDKELMDICSKKPPAYRREMSLKEKIEVMKHAGIHYGEQEQLHRLMAPIHARNVISIANKQEYRILDEFQIFLHTYEERIDPALMKLMRSSLKKCSTIVAIEDVENEANDVAIELIDYLAREIQTMSAEIQRFFDDHKSQKPETKKALEFMRDIQKRIKFVELSDNPDNNYQFVKNAIHDISTVFPNMIIHNADAITPKIVWKFSPSHEGRLAKHFKAFYGQLAPFMDQDNVLLHRVLKTVSDGLAFYGKWIDALPVYSEITIGKDVEKRCYRLFNEKTVNLMLKYIWHSCLYTFMEFSKNDSVINENRRDQVKRQDELEDEQQDELHDISDDIRPYEDIRSSQTLSTNEIFAFTKTMSYILQTFILLEKEILDDTDFNYESIMAESFKISEREKKDRIDKIGNMNKYEQQVDKLMRNLKLGSYYVEPSFFTNPDYFEKGTVQQPVVIGDGEEEGGPEEIDNDRFDPESIEENDFGEVEFDGNN